MHVDQHYQSLLRRLRADGDHITTRNSTVRRLIHESSSFYSTPLVSVRKTAWKNALREWEWFMSGSHNIKDLHPDVRSWWEPWATPEGWVSYNYGSQFRHFFGRDGCRDQIQDLVTGLRDHPYSRRHILTTWNPSDMRRRECPITNCHNTMTQAFVDSQDRLTLVTYQRSVDVICGLPHNWVQMWAFLLWLAHLSGRVPWRLDWVGGDVHLYDAHTDVAARITDAAAAALHTPELVYTPTAADFRADDFTLGGPYEPLFSQRAVLIT